MIRAISALGILSLGFLGTLNLSHTQSAIATVKPLATNQQVSRSYFTKSPRLLGEVTTHSGVRVSYAKYYFNLELPQDAGNSLQQIAISQRQGQEAIQFRLDKTVAYLGTNKRKGEKLEIAEVIEDPKTKTINITLQQPLTPGTSLTVGIKPKRNPDYDGVYLFGVKAYPQGQNPYGLYLGVGRLHFYRGYDGFSSH